MQPEFDRPQLAVRRVEQDGVRVIELAGELDLQSVGELERALADGARSRVCLDLTALAFIDSSGLGAIVRAHLAITGAGGAMAIAAPPGTVRRTLAASGLLALLEVLDDRASALRALA